MALRDIPYRQYVITFLVAGLAPEVIEALPAALERSLAAPAGGPPGTSEADGVVDSADEELDDAGLIATAGRRPLAADSVAVTVSGDRMVLRLSHRRFDGTTGMQFLHDLIDRACGFDPERDLRPIAPLPVLSALRSFRPRALQDFRVRRAQGRLTTPGAVPRPSATPAFTVFDLPEDVVRAVKRSRGPWVGQGRATLSTKLCHAVLTSLRAVQQEPGDLRVRVPADLRHLVPSRRVLGNFVCGDAIGTLHGTAWTPPEITRRLSAASGVSGAVSVATAWPRDLVARVAHRFHRPSSAVNVSLVPSRSFPPNAFSDGRRRLACVSAGRAPSPVFVFVWSIDDMAFVSVYDDTGLFDLAAFAPRVLEELRSTYSPR